MSEEILINVTPMEIRVALIENGPLHEIFIEPHNGGGDQKSVETVCYEIFREILHVAKAYENDMLLVMASQIVVDRLLDEESTSLAELEN